MNISEMRSVIYALDTDGLGAMLDVIDDIITRERSNAYENGYNDGWDECYETQKAQLIEEVY